MYFWLAGEIKPKTLCSILQVIPVPQVSFQPALAHTSFMKENERPDKPSAKKPSQISSGKLISWSALDSCPLLVLK